MISRPQQPYFSYQQFLGELSLGEVVILHNDLVIALSDRCLADELVLGASCRHAEVVDELRGLHVDPLRQLVLPESDEVGFVKGRHQVAVVECRCASLAVNQIDDVWIEVILTDIVALHDFSAGMRAGGGSDSISSGTLRLGQALIGVVAAAVVGVVNQAVLLLDAEVIHKPAWCDAYMRLFWR